MFDSNSQFFFHFAIETTTGLKKKCTRAELHKLSYIENILQYSYHCVGLNDDLGLQNEQAKLTIKYNLPKISYWEVIFYDFMVSLASSFCKPKSSLKLTM